MEMPFKIPKYYHCRVKTKWKSRGVDITNFDFWYNKYIYATECELCKTKFLKKHHRCLDHNHETGKIRNIVCQKCNCRKYDKKHNSSTGYKHIYKDRDRNCYRFEIKRIVAKRSKDLNELIAFRDKWYIDNNYPT
jgi:hypothetical protein